MNLERLLGGDDGPFPDVVPPHLKEEGVDAKVINAFLYYSGNPGIKTRLFQQMNPATEAALLGTLEWLVASERKEHYALLRVDIWRQLQAIEEEKKKIFPNGISDAVDEVYVTYLIKQGLSAEQANSWWRKFLLARDANLAQISGRGTIYSIEPKGFGPYAMLAYPLRLAVRHFMLQGADTQRYYNWTAGPSGS